MLTLYVWIPGYGPALLYADCSSMVMRYILYYFVCWVHRTIELSPGLKVSKLFRIHFTVKLLDINGKHVLYGLFADLCNHQVGPAKKTNHLKSQSCFKISYPSDLNAPWYCNCLVKWYEFISEFLLAKGQFFSNCSSRRRVSTWTPSAIPAAQEPLWGVDGSVVNPIHNKTKPIGLPLTCKYVERI